MTLLEAKRLLGVKPFGEGNVSCTHNVSAHVDVSALPTDFDARTTWPTFVHPVRDQGQCGSCWAHAASETFSDKLAIATNGSVNEIFSVQELVSCDTAKDMVPARAGDALCVVDRYCRDAAVAGPSMRSTT